MQLPFFSAVCALLTVVAFAENPYVRQFPGSTGCPDSNEGKVFYLAYMSNNPDEPKNVPVEVFVTTYTDTAEVTVEWDDNQSEKKTVQKNTIVRFQIPRDKVVLENTGSTSRAKAVKVTSDQKIVVYGANKEQYTTDAFLALPENVIGKEYFAIAWYPPTNFVKPDYCQIGIAATKDGASVEITLPQAIDGDEGCKVDVSGSSYSNGQTFTVQLNCLEAFQLQAKCDLSGTRIKSTNPVSVFSGNARTAIGEKAITRDHLVEQLMPVNTWGRKFITVPTPKRSVGDYFKIVASEDATEITVSGRKMETKTKTLNAGQQWLLNITCVTYAVISATKPIEVAAFVKSQTTTSEPADPAMSLMLPLEQLGVGYTFTTVEGVATTYTNYMTVVCQKGKEGTLTLDGSAITPADGWTEIPSANATSAYVQLTAGTHTLTSSSGDARFAAYIYGAGDRESYYYPTGMCLKSLACPKVDGCCCSACPSSSSSFFF